jgi:hypothetical protein
MAETDPEKLADHLEDEADELERRNEELGKKADDVAQEWEAKRSDPGVPGAPAPTGEQEGASPTGSPSGKDDED